jgi:hypothetical protein
MKLDILIIGQGIAGTITSYQLINKGYSVGIINNTIQTPSSKLASAIINPLSGKKWHQIAHFNAFLEDSLSSYKGIEKIMNQSILQPKDHVYFFQSKEEQIIAKQQINPAWYEINEEKAFKDINSPHGYAQIKQCYCIDQNILFEKWKQFIAHHYYYDASSFEQSALKYENNCWQYRDVQARNIIFCEGIGAKQNPFFNNLPFTKNRGDVLYVNIAGLDNNYIYSFKERLVPIQDQLFWLGSNHTWEYTDLLKNEEWAIRCLQDLQEQLPYPIQLIDHKVAERPTSIGQQAMAMQHKDYPNMGLLNGLGTRGFLQASTRCKDLLTKMQL